MSLRQRSPFFNSTQSLGTYNDRGVVPGVYGRPGDMSFGLHSPGLEPPKNRWGVLPKRSKNPKSATFVEPLPSGVGYVKTVGPKPSKVKTLFGRNKPPKSFSYKGVSSAEYFANHPGEEGGNTTQRTRVPTPPSSEATESPQQFPLQSPLPHTASIRSKPPVPPVVPKPVVVPVPQGRLRSNTQPAGMLSPPLSPNSNAQVGYANPKALASPPLLPLPPPPHYESATARAQAKLALAAASTVVADPVESVPNSVALVPSHISPGIRAVDEDMSVITLRKRVPLSSLPSPLTAPAISHQRKSPTNGIRMKKNIDLSEALISTMTTGHEEETLGSGVKPNNCLWRSSSNRSLKHVITGPSESSSLEEPFLRPRSPNPATLGKSGLLSPSPLSGPPATKVAEVGTTSFARNRDSTASAHPSTGGTKLLPSGFKAGDDIPLSALWTLMNEARSGQVSASSSVKSLLRAGRPPLRTSSESCRTNPNASSTSLHSLTGVAVRSASLGTPASASRHLSMQSPVGTAFSSTSPPHSGPPPISTHLAPRLPPHLARKRSLRNLSQGSRVSSASSHVSDSGVPATTGESVQSSTQLQPHPSHTCTSSNSQASPTEQVSESHAATFGFNSGGTPSARRRAQSRPVPPPLDLTPALPESVENMRMPPPLQSAPTSYPGTTLSNQNQWARSKASSAMVDPNSPEMCSPTSSVRSRPSVSSSSTTATCVASPSPAHPHSSGVLGNGLWRKSNRPISSASYNGTHKPPAQYSPWEDDRVRDEIRQQLRDEEAFDAMLKKSKFTLKVSLTPQTH
ncbi:hypothetical protein IWQ61_004644 [Dispira simplex]|nr:hypothetical protein IWQ61_004644 [Dispira simplex]